MKNHLDHSVAQILGFNDLLLIESFFQSNGGQPTDFVRGFVPTAQFLQRERLESDPNSSVLFDLQADDDGGLLQLLTPFAKANSFGVYYAFWSVVDDGDWSQLPIVIFNSDGDAYVVAHNFREFLILLTTDVYPRVDRLGVSYNRSPLPQPASPRLSEWLAFLQQTFGVEAVVNPQLIVDKAQMTLQMTLENMLDSDVL